MKKAATATIIVLLSLLVALGAMSVLGLERNSYEYSIDSAPDEKLLPYINDLGGRGWRIIHARRALDGDGQPSYEFIMVRRGL